MAAAIVESVSSAAQSAMKSLNLGGVSGSPELQQTVSPVDQSIVVTRPIPTSSELESIVARSHASFQTYKLLSLSDRIAIAERFLQQLKGMKEQMARDLCLQMGRPIRHCGVEVDGTIKRGEHMIYLAKSGVLDDSENKDTDTPDHIRYVKRVPVGPVLVISPWNYPWFCQVNAVLPALIAGNSVILKPSPQTPLCGDHFLTAYTAAGLPQDVLQVAHLTPSQVESTIKDPRIGYVQFTGSVTNGHACVRAASNSFKAVGVELGGKDPAYVRRDADLDKAVPGLVDGVYFNQGQSCCSVERIYVDKDIFDEFVQKFVSVSKSMYKLGPPSDPSTTLGPVVSRHSATNIRKQVADAIQAGATPLLHDTDSAYLTTQEGRAGNFVPPQVLVNVDHSMSIMKDETFGPVIGIMPVSSDDEAIKLMNDSIYGLTASVWTDATKSRAEFVSIMDQLEAGTVYLNNCDNLDPALAWSGWKDSGRGVSLSRFGFDAYVKTKSVSIKVL